MTPPYSTSKPNDNKKHTHKTLKGLEHGNLRIDFMFKLVCGTDCIDNHRYPVMSRKSVLYNQLP